MKIIPPEYQRIVHCHDHVTSHEELRPLAVIEGFDERRQRWVTLFEVTEWAPETGRSLEGADHYAKMRLRYVRRG